MTTEEFAEKVNQSCRRQFTVLGEFSGLERPIEVMCNHCGNRFIVNRASALLTRNMECTLCFGFTLHSEHIKIPETNVAYGKQGE